MNFEAWWDITLAMANGKITIPGREACIKEITKLAWDSGHFKDFAKGNATMHVSLGGDVIEWQLQRLN